MNITLNISLPVLLAGQGFRIRHRVQYNTVWTDDGVFTTQSPLITGLSESTCYEFEITFLESVSPLVECDPIIEIICTPTEQPCATFDYTYEKTQTYYTIEITFTLPSPTVVPCGGYRLYYGPVGSPQTFTIATFPSFPTTYLIPTSSPQDWIFYLYSVDCDGNEFLCDTLIAEYEPEDCTGTVLIDADLTYSPGASTLTLTFTPSSPQSTQYIITYWQCQNVTTGVADSGTYPANSTGNNPEVIIVPINPNPSGAGGRITYCGTITDICNKSTNFDVSILI